MVFAPLRTAPTVKLSVKGGIMTWVTGVVPTFGKTLREATYEIVVNVVARLLAAVQVFPSGLVAEKTVRAALFPVAIHTLPFHAIPLPGPPVKGLFAEAVHVLPFELKAIELLALDPTATHIEPFQATPITKPPENGLFDAAVQVIPSGLVPIPFTPTPTQYEPFQASP
jgi:hypothetical protein